MINALRLPFGRKQFRKLALCDYGIQYAEIIASTARSLRKSGNNFSLHSANDKILQTFLPLQGDSATIKGNRIGSIGAA